MTGIADAIVGGEVKPSIADRIRKNQRTLARAIAGSAAALGVLVLASLGLGAVDIPPAQTISIILANLSLPAIAEFSTRDELILSAIRAPRTVLGVLAGGALALSGAALQGLFRNPLADPTLIGVSSGAALGAVAVILLGAPLLVLLPSVLQPALLPIAAFGGGLVAIFLVYVIAQQDGGTNIATLLLAGAAVTAIGGAGIGLFIFVGDDQQIRDINFWLLGSLSGAHWPAIAPAAIFIIIGIIGVLRFSRALDALSLGEEDAHHLGFEPERIKRRLILCCALATGASVSLTGVIGFVGLVTPHIVRMLFGPAHAALLPTSILLGASLMLAADIIARTIAAPAELPIGIVTAAIGGPFFLWLLMRGRAKGGW
jgi:iron complex transport system permease protein